MTSKKCAARRSAATCIAATLLAFVLAAGGSRVALAGQLTGVTPSTVAPNSTEDVVLTGMETGFLQDQTTVGFGADITVNSVTVISSTVLVANISVAPTAAAGPRTIAATTDTESLTLSGKFSVAAGGLAPPKPPRPPYSGPQLYTVMGLLHATGKDKDGFTVDIGWGIDGQLWLNGPPNAITARMNNSSHAAPSAQASDFLRVNVAQWLVQGKDGTQATLTSPRSFALPLGPLSLNLAAANPVLTVPFTQTIPQETIEVKGQSAKASFFAGMLGVVVTSNVLTLPQVQAMTGNTANGSSMPDKSALDQAAASLKAHAGDINWLMSAEGQAAIASMQQQAMAQVSIPASQATTPAQMAATLQSLLLPWKYRSAAPVKQNLHFTKDQLDITLKFYIYAQQAID